jgi:hypothetical protein
MFNKFGFVGRWILWMIVWMIELVLIFILSNMSKWFGLLLIPWFLVGIPPQATNWVRRADDIPESLKLPND